MPEIVCHTLNDLKPAAEALLKAFPDKRIFAFYASMGTGKTTFIKILCEQLQAIDVANSPTFAIVNVYRTLSQKNIYHFDFYRLKEPSEAFDIGFEDYAYSGDYCFIEWPEKIENLLPPDCIEVKMIRNDDNDARTIYF